MIISKKLLTMLCLTTLVAAGMGAMRMPDPEFRNLKILPKDISGQKLDSIMQSYNKALDVDCKFCHQKNESLPDSLDFASDENVMKENAREMMRMTIHINKTHFYFDKNERPEYLKVVTCFTCHRGDPYPVDLAHP